MTQSTILAAGQTAGTSTDVTLAAGAEAILSIYAADMATPVNATHTTATTGGSLTAATYYYRVSAINALGETLASTETSIVVPGGTSTNIVTVKWAAVTGATGYRVYGRATGAELFIAEVGVVLQYVDTGAITPAGALPAANTTAGGIPPDVYALVKQATPGKDNVIYTLTAAKPAEAFKGPATYRVFRPVLAGGLNIGVASDV